MLRFSKDEKNERVEYLLENGRLAGAVWLPNSKNEWCWSLHGDGESLAQGLAEDAAGAKTDLVAAFWNHIDADAAFPA